MTENKTELKFKSGDIVKLNSGGPNMIVVDYYVAMDLISYIIDGSPVTSTKTTRVNVVYFEGDVKRKGQFEQSLLELA
jgi:predicted secreted hydrolase